LVDDEHEGGTTKEVCFGRLFARGRPHPDYPTGSCFYLLGQVYRRRSARNRRRAEATEGATSGLTTQICSQAWGEETPYSR